LPGFMVPSVFVELAALPRTPAGKVDRRALPAPSSERPEVAAYRVPQGPTEQALAGIFAEVLGLERVGADDDFFDLGGHSLLATRVMARMTTTFGVEMGLRVLFETPTVSDLAVLVDVAIGYRAEPVADVEQEEFEV